ncbi:TetR family transcriptional regulator [Variovorax sp. LG9.2]|uniref:TetR family transcriptional regulator n=1 Tax=Variovorax sp. LG9.2 TaxID=3048626 RepID=UPI002B23E739|nr:TetR family transcriptional regulator [Variovorax sp. LG9.2]MEB0060086.1 TetR family transcriptional regulator [Variovorax sp. LG9.2]
MARRTKEEALATRHRLIDAAEILFQSQGVSKTSLQQIAEQAGATRGAVYWHFKDKADLFNAMMERVKLPMENATRFSAEPSVDPLAVIEAGMIVALRLVTTDPQARRVFEVATQKVEYVGEMASVRLRHLEARNSCVADFEKALRLAARRAQIKLTLPASTAAQGLHALISGLIHNWLLDPEAFALMSVGRRTFNVYLSGLGFDRTGARIDPSADPVALESLAR